MQHRRAAAGFVATAVACALLTFGASVVAPWLALDPRVGFAIAFLAVTAEILACAWVVPALTPTAAGAAVVVTGATLGVLGWLAVPSAPWSAATLTFAIALGATAVGALLGARIEQPGQLAAVALVSAVADLWSVFDPAAPSARFAEQALAEPERLALFALPFPLLGTPLIAPVIGAGDLVFSALYLAAFRRHELRRRALLLAFALAYLLGLLGLLVWLRPLPLLPLLGIAALLADRRARSLTPREWRTVGIVCGALFVAVALLRTR